MSPFVHANYHKAQRASKTVRLRLAKRAATLIALSAEKPNQRTNFFLLRAKRLFVLAEMALK